ncbi:AraC-type DNA-binding protein [Clostridium amylolyticum]|uniref:AraC-type DNA-binding protein n=1 Tax=Clostridium amylolyticum TaxID=1121298 RepID=A0A1M6LXH2_9CLOT|nr:AraC family transcriptional regulator [Clostridium amylolyticum]SHJ75865.1 AraC-type DNA-binding protein [Clostridium amylolyticum]
MEVILIEEFTKTILKELPIILPKDFPIYEFNNVIIFKPNYIINKQFQLSCYHFIISSMNANLPNIIVDNKKCAVENNKIFSTNPGQVILGVEEKVVEPYISLFIHPDFLSGVSEFMYGKSKVCFDNISSIYSNDLISYTSLFIKEFQNKHSGYEFILQSITLQIVIHLLRHCKSNIKLSELQKNHSKKDNINKVIDFLKSAYNYDFSLQQLSSIANLSPYHFLRIFKAETGKTPYNYLMDIKIENCKELLKGNQYSITEIALACGFNSPSHFSSVFKKRVGVTPSAYKEMI